MAVINYTIMYYVITDVIING